MYLKSSSLVTVTCAVGALAAGAGTSLDPVQPVSLPNGAFAKNPLARLGGNGPWTVGKSIIDFNNITCHESD